MMRSMWRTFYPSKSRFIATLVCLLLIGCSSAPARKTQGWDDSQLRAQRLTQAHAAYSAKRYRLASHLLLPIAENGDSEAQYSLGYLFFYGLGIDQNREHALAWFKRAAKAGSLKAETAIEVIAVGEKLANGVPSE